MLYQVSWWASVVLPLLGVLAWQKVCNSPAPWLSELQTLGRPRRRKLPSTAVVCGASIAGIVAARICADHFERVVVIEPEILDPKKPRTRILQYNALHVYLHLFIKCVRRLWVEFDHEMKAAGARPSYGIAPTDYQVHYAGVLLPVPYAAYPPGEFPETLVIRRSTTQTVLHQLLLKNSSNITFLPGTVRGMQAATGTSSIEHVSFRRADGRIETLDDVGLLADCTGAAQSGFKWLTAAGFPVPQSLRCTYDAKLCYLTITFTLQPGFIAKLPIPDALRNTATVFSYTSRNSTPAHAVALTITDNDTMQLLLSNTAYERLPRQQSDVLPFMEGCESYKYVPRWLTETISMLCEYGSVLFDTIKIPPQSYVRYDRAPVGSMPMNFVALGDASLYVNPAYGQGFAKATLNGIALNSVLHTARVESGVPVVSARYFAKSAEWMSPLWDATRLHDYGDPSSKAMEGESKETGSFARWFERTVVFVAAQDGEVASTLWHVQHMLTGSKTMFAPVFLWRVLRSYMATRSFT